MYGDDEFVPFRGFSQGKNQEKDYSKSISFVSSSTVENKQEEEEIQLEEEEKEEELDEYIIEEEDLAQTYAKKKQLSNNDFKSFFTKKQNVTEEEVKEDKEEKFFVILPKKTEESARKKRKIEEKKEKKETEDAPKRQKEFATFLDAKVGKNVLNMMLNMGYDYDKGLGKEQDGRVNPIQMVSTDKGRGEIVSEESEKKKEELKKNAFKLPSREDNWKKDRNKKPKVKFITADELIDKSNSKGVPLVNEILDLTGPQPRILKTSEISSQNTNALSRVLPELQYNINQLVSLSENSIQENDKNLKFLKEKLVNLESQKLKLLNRIEKERKDKKELSQVVHKINSYHFKINQSEEIDFYELKETFEHFKINFPETYKKFNISKCILAIIAPTLTKLYENWIPFEEPKKFEQIKFWKKMFTDESDYEQLLNDVVIPNIRKSLLELNLKKPDAAVKFFEIWKKLLTEKLLDSLYDNLLIPRINKLVEEWNPKVELIHLSIFPWLPFIDVKLELFGILESIRFKISQMLNEWNPSDLSAHAYLKLWKDVFDPRDFNKLLNQCIIPKLTIYLSKEFKVNPSNQDIEPFLNVVKWNDLISNSIFVSIFEQEFFPKWTMVLYHWLKNDPKFDEILNWYNGWKELFNEKFNENERIHSLFNKGLDMINQTLSGQEIILQDVKEDYEEKIEKLKPKVRDLSFRELLEQYAADSDILFEPKGHQNYRGKQLYLFGGVTLYIDNDVIYTKVKESYQPVSLDELIEMTK
jgi:tuftelin-interacting protein 11